MIPAETIEKMKRTAEAEKSRFSDAEQSCIILSLLVERDAMLEELRKLRRLVADKFDGQPPWEQT